jgi:ABC-type antimicrobial peptide transport system permease subunit
MLAAMGLYGLMTLNVAGRVREFSIRKVMGANLSNIIATITNQYLILFLIGIVLGAPVSYYLINLLIDTAYEYHMPLDFSGVTIAVVILACVVAVTLSTQVRKVWRSNPVNGLKTE